MDRRDTWRIATLNMWNRQGPWPERLALIREQLAALDLDAIALQEVMALPGHANQAEEIVAGLGWNVHFGSAMTLGGGLQFGNAIASPHPLRDTAVFELPVPTPVEAAGGRFSSAQIETRAVTFARIDAPHGPIPMFSTHLTYQLHLGHVRDSQVRALAARVGELAPLGGPPPVLAGDFNAEPDSDEMRYLRGLTALGGRSVYFADCWAATADRAGAEHRGNGMTFDRRNRFAALAHEPPRRIDYIYVRGPDRNLRGEPLACELAFTAPRDDVWPSDHFGVVADIAAATRPLH